MARFACRSVLRLLPVAVSSVALVPGPSKKFATHACCDDASEIAALRRRLSKLEDDNVALLDTVQALTGKLEQTTTIYRIVITGGPCAGKTTAMAELKERLENVGWRVFLVPEAATILFHHGARFADFSANGEAGIVSFQAHLAQLQMRIEDTMHEMAAASGDKSVLLIDRGVMDGKAYCPSLSSWALVLDRIGGTEAQVRDRRYDAVIHLVSAAVGAEEHYTLQQCGGGESSRFESLEEARVLDERTCQAWVGHEHLNIIDNCTNFTRKMQRAVNRVCKVLGEPVPGYRLRKFRLPHMSVDEVVARARGAGIQNCRVFLCDTTYVSPSSRVRMRCDPDHHGASYYMQEFVEISGKPRRQREQLITSQVYLQRMKEANADGYQTLHKQLVVFKYGGDVYEANIFKETLILEVEAESLESNIVIPPFLGEGAVEVTNDSMYNTKRFAGIRTEPQVPSER